MIVTMVATCNLNVIAQSLIYSTDQNKHCTIRIAMSEVKNNQFDITLKVNWVDDNVKPLNDYTSVVGFDVDKIWCNQSQFVRLISREKDQPVISFNSELKLSYELREEFPGGEVQIKYPFFYAPNQQASLKPESRQEFTLKRPRDYKISFTLDKSTIIDKTPPKLAILLPADVEKGLKPIVDSNAVRVMLSAKDFFGIDRIQINDISPVRVGDSLYVADIPLKVGYENPIAITVKDKSGLTTQKEFKVEARKPMFVVSNTVPEKQTSITRLPSDVDIDIPQVATPNRNRFALIIGNEDYSTFQNTLQVESDVEFAIHDAQVFREYAIKVLGVPEENIIMRLNAKVVEMMNELKVANSIIKNMKGQAEYFVFYAGHGFPDEQTREPYLIPVDISGSNVEFAIKLSDFYRKLTEFPSKRVTVFLDACFSGGGRNLGLMAARGVKVKPKEGILKGNLVVFSASSGEQSSLPYREKQHGMFTYYLFKKLKETNGEITYNDLSSYLSTEVSIRSAMINNKEQNPETNISPELGERWKGWKIK